MTNRTAIYTRISSDRAGAGIGVKRQERECRELADKKGWAVVTVYSDNDLSAYSGKKRPGYLQLMDDVKAGQYDRLLAWHQDRLHRNTRELEDFIDIIEAADVLVDTVAGGQYDLKTPNGRMHARISGVVARNSSEQASERIKSKFREKAVNGEWHGGVRPFGYEKNGVTVRKAEAKLVVRATKQVLAGASLRDIARDLNQRGVTSSLGKPWTPNQVKTLVLRARNIAKRRHHGQVIGDACWPAIVDEVDFYAAKAILTDPSRRTTSTNGRKYLLSGIVTCGECGGGTVIAKWVRSRSKARLVYECRYHHCTARALHHVDRLVEETVIARLERDDARDLLATKDEGGDGGAALRAEMDELQGRLDQAADAFASGDITMSQLGTITSKCQSRLEEVERLLATASREPVLASLVTARDPRKVWDGLSLARKRSVISTLITVQLFKTDRRGPGFDPDSVKIDWIG